MITAQIVKTVSAAVGTSTKARRPRILSLIQRLTYASVAVLAASGHPAVAVVGGPVCNVPVDYATIQGAVSVVGCTTVIVANGTYTENVTINHNLVLKSVNGRASTTITGISNGALGTITVTSNTTSVQIGATGQGFTINGIDNPSPGSESAAIYFQGNHSGAQILDNEVVANGDAGLQTEFGATISGFVVSGNTFSGQTFIGANPAGCGFGSQFTLANVSRQLVVIGGGAGGGSHSNITFTNNTITGTAGGCSSSPASVGGCLASGEKQGNTLVTIDSNGATITGNTFSGTTSRSATSLRARGPSTTVSGNSFVSTGLVASCTTPTVPALATGQVLLQNTGQTVQAAAAANTFDKGVYIDGTIGTIGLSIQAFASAVPASTTIHVLSGTYAEQITITTNGITVDAAPGTVVRPTTVVSDNTQGSPCSNGVGTAIVLVSAATGVTLNNLNVDGSGIFPTMPARFIGIYYRNASGAINGGSVLNIRDNPLEGAQNGLGIYAQAKGPNSITVNVTGVTVSGYQKNGITFNGCGAANAPDGNVTGIASGNTVTGAGATPAIAQNGIQVGFGAGPITITGNDITGDRYTGNPSNGTGAGILIFSSQNNIITLNDVSASNSGIALASDVNTADTTGNMVTCNRVTGNNAFPYETGVQADAAANTVHNNAIQGNSIGVDGTGISSGILDATNNWWGCATGANTPGCDTATANVLFVPFTSSIPPCVSCTSNADCNDGLACTGAEICVSGACVAGTPVQCPGGTCSELTGNCTFPIVPDTDLDEVPNRTDNCRSVANAGQADGDGDGIGDACDICPVNFNAFQTDLCTGNRTGTVDATALILKRVRLRAAPQGTIQVTGVLDTTDYGGFSVFVSALREPATPDNSTLFRAHASFAVNVSGAGLQTPGQVLTFPPCVSVSGCSGTNGETARFLRQGSTNLMNVTVRASGKSFQAPLAAAGTTVTLSVGGIDHRATASSCRVFGGKGKLVGCR